MMKSKTSRIIYVLFIINGLFNSPISQKYVQIMLLILLSYYDLRYLKLPNSFLILLLCSFLLSMPNMLLSAESLLFKAVLSSVFMGGYFLTEDIWSGGDVKLILIMLWFYGTNIWPILLISGCVNLTIHLLGRVKNVPLAPAVTLSVCMLEMARVR